MAAWYDSCLHLAVCVWKQETIGLAFSPLRPGEIAQSDKQTGEAPAVSSGVVWVCVWLWLTRGTHEPCGISSLQNT